MILRLFALGFCIAFWGAVVWSLSGCALSEPPTFADQTRTVVAAQWQNLGVWP